MTVIDLLEKGQFAERADHLGKMMLERLRQELKIIPGVVSIRGKGLMFGIELNRECSELVKLALAERLLINVTAGNVIRLLPPLIITDDEAEQITAIVCKLVRQFLQG